MFISFLLATLSITALTNTALDCCTARISVSGPIRRLLRRLRANAQKYIPRMILCGTQLPPVVGRGPKERPGRAHYGNISFFYLMRCTHMKSKSLLCQTECALLEGSAALTNEMKGRGVCSREHRSRWNGKAYRMTESASLCVFDTSVSIRLREPYEFLVFSFPLDHIPASLIPYSHCHGGLLGLQDPFHSVCHSLIDTAQWSVEAWRVRRKTWIGPYLPPFCLTPMKVALLLSSESWMKINLPPLVFSGPSSKAKRNLRRKKKMGWKG